MKSRIRYLVLTIILIQCFTISAQEDWGGRFGVNMQFGTHVQRFGLMYQLYYFKNHVQVSHSVYASFVAKNLGPFHRGVELKMQAGLQGQWIKSQTEKFLMNELSNLSPFQNSIGYSFYYYLDDNKTSQSTGSLHGSVSEFIWVIDNDALGLNQIDDKFRTGGLYFAYQKDSLLLGIQSTLWTGKSVEAPRVNDDNYPSRFGYRDITKSTYGDKSHGILALRADYKWEYEQVIRGEIGLDSERIRHILQNKLIHDGISGRFVKSESPHYPMLQDDGHMFLFKETERVKKAKPYLQFGLNQSILY